MLCVIKKSCVFIYFTLTTVISNRVPLKAMYVHKSWGSTNANSTEVHNAHEACKFLANRHCSKRWKPVCSPLNFTRDFRSPSKQDQVYL